MSQQNIIPSPYHFVPMAEEVFYPNWQKTSLDYPEKENISGVIEYELQNFSPLLVGDERTKDQYGDFVDFFKTPDNQYAIPGTSIKGMIRNWLEIATHSKMSILNDTWLSFRDLRNKEYTELLTEPLGNQTYKPRTKAGWLQFNNGQWELYPAESWRIENEEIERTFKIKINDKDSQKIYIKLNGLQPVNFNHTEEKAHSHSGGKQLIYARAENLKKANDNNAKGFLVVTGQIPGSRNPKPGQSKGKHMNFIFANPAKDKLEFLNQNVIKGFLDINLEREDFKYLKSLKHSNGIPVFYIPNNGQVSQMGMAQMFRFPYKHSVGQLRHNSHLTNKDTRLDFAELLFGQIDDEGKESNNRKGRVSFSLVKCQNGDIKPITLAPTVLGAPRNSFYPAYIDQKSAKNAYNTYNQNESKLAGFKRYAIHKNFNKQLPKPPTIKEKTNYKVAVQLRPLPENQKFSGKIRFHNLNPVELGALIYAINLGSTPEGLFHQLGMGKPYGLGKVKLNVEAIHFDDKRNLTKEALSEAFLSYVNKQITSSQALSELLILQSDKTFSPTELKYLDFPKAFIATVASKGAKKLSDISIKAAAILKQQQEAEKETKRQQKIQLMQKQEKERLNQKTPVEQLIIDELGGVLDKTAIDTLENNPTIWQELSEDSQMVLIEKIKIGPYYDTSNTKVRKKIRGRLGDLGKKFNL